MTYEAFLESLNIKIGSEEEDRLIEWAFDLDEEDFEEPISDEELEESEEMTDQQVIELIQLCIDSDPDWKTKVFRS